MKKYVILTVVCVGLFKILTTRLIDFLVHKVCPIVQTSETISRKEADFFFQKWQEYKMRGYVEKVPENFAFDEVNMVDRLPWIVKLWMDKNCIDASRFYYTEQRMRAALKAYDIRKHAESVIAILSEQITPDMDAGQKEWYKTLIEDQKKMVKIEGVTDEELKIVEGREKQLQKLLN